MKAVLYVRVSSSEQEKEGYSLDAQEKLGHEYARRKDFEIVRTWKISESAWRSERTAPRPGKGRQEEEPPDPKAWQTARASSMSRVEPQQPKPVSVLSSRSVTPITRWPSALSKAAATEESTPPDIATTAPVLGSNFRNFKVKEGSCAG